MNFTQADITRLLRILQNNKANAIHAYDIALQLGYPTNGNQVETRSLIRFAIQNGHFVLSNTRIGYWVSSDQREIIKYIKSLQSRAADTELRGRELRTTWNNLNPNNQI